MLTQPANCGTTWHLIGKNEGDGFRKPQHRDYQSRAETVFWKKYLLGQ